MSLFLRCSLTLAQSARFGMTSGGAALSLGSRSVRDDVGGAALSTTRFVAVAVPSRAERSVRDDITLSSASRLIWDEKSRLLHLLLYNIQSIRKSYFLITYPNNPSVSFSGPAVKYKRIGSIEAVAGANESAHNPSITIGLFFALSCPRNRPSVP
jgi:hypothetical protein